MGGGGEGVKGAGLVVGGWWWWGGLHICKQFEMHERFLLSPSTVGKLFASTFDSFPTYLAAVAKNRRARLSFFFLFKSGVFSVVSSLHS